MRQKGDKREQERVAKLYVHEENCYNNGSKLVAGVDEAGRGPLAGPVVASAVILPPLIFLPGLNDSKLVAEPKRTKLSREIAARAQSVGIGVVDAALIDKHNILEATRGNPGFFIDRRG